MQLKKCLLTSLIFAPMWVGAEVPLREVFVEQQSAVRVQTPIVIQQEEKINPYIILFLSIFIACLLGCTVKQKKSVVLLFIMVIFSNILRALPKNKKNYHYHFYAVRDIQRL